jgi:hypothetical protein
MSHQDHQSLVSPPQRILAVQAQNRLHLPLIKRTRADMVFDHISLPRKKFILSTRYSTGEDLPIKNKSFREFQINQITTCYINNHLK